MNKRFIKFLLLILNASSFFWVSVGLCADLDDEFELAPPPEINIPQNSKEIQEETDDEILPAPELKTPDDESEDSSKGKQDQNFKKNLKTNLMKYQVWTPPKS